MHIIPAVLVAVLVEKVVAVHFHHAVLVWVVFYVGQLLHAALQIDSIARKTGKLRRDIIAVTGIRVVYRIAWCSAIFGLIFVDPTFVAQIAQLLGHPLGADETAVLSVPLNNPLALVYGLALDSVMGYIPMLKSQLPDVDVVQDKTPTQ